MEPIYFAGADEFRAWLAANHRSATEVVVGYHKVATGRPSMTWAQSVDEALCFGWIDGIRRRVDGERYTIRFTPRKPRSRWSDVNIRRVGELSTEGRMTPAGLAAYEARGRDADYSYQDRDQAQLTPAQERRFKANKKAWTFFTAQAPSYRRTVIHMVTSAKKEETRERRLAALIEASEAGRRLV